MKSPCKKFLLPKIAFVIGLFVHAPLPAHADVYWNNNNGAEPGGDRSWGNAANWIGGSPSAPGAGNAIVKPWPNLDQMPIVDTADNTANQVYLTEGSSVRVVAGGSLAVSAYVTGQWNNCGVTDVSGGLLQSGSLLLGSGGFDGKLNISGGSVVANHLSINSSGGAKINIAANGSFVAPISNLGNINYWINANTIVAYNGSKRWTINTDTNSQAGNVVLTATAAYTGQSYWTTSGGGNWTNTTNWNLAGGAPGLDGSLSLNDTATFDTNGSGSVTLNTNASLTSLTFSNASASYTLSGTGAIALQAGSNQPTINNLAGNHTASNALFFATNVIVTNATGSSLTLAGTISGSGLLRKTGAGTLILSRSNDYTGGTIITAGGIKLGASSALGSGANNIVIGNTGTPDSGAELDLNGYSQTVAAQVYLQKGGGLSLTNGGSLAATDLVTGINGDSRDVNVSGGGLITLSGYLNMGAGGGDGKVNILDGGQIVANSLSINSSGGARMNISGSGSFKAPISNLGNVNYWIANKIIRGFGNTNGWWVNVDTNSQPGQLVLQAAGLVDNITATYSNVMNYAGPTIITNNGVLNLAGGGDRLNTATNVVVASGVLNLGGNNQTVAGLTGEGTVNKAGGTLTVNVSEGSDAFAGVLAGAGNLVKTGSGTLVLSGTNTHSGNTLVSDGSLELASIGSLRFAIGGSGTNTALLGSGAASLDGQFLLDLSAASTSTSATWTIVANTLTADYGPHFIVAGFSGAGGNWTNTTNGVKYIFSQSTGVLSVQSATINNYANWLTNYPSLTGVDALRGADPDSDGFDNGMEFAFDGNPTIGSPAFLTGVNVGPNVAFNYIARKNPPGGVTYQLQHTTNLSAGPWTNSFVTVSNSANQTGINIPADYERKEFVVPCTNNNFFRVRATIAP